MGIVPSRLRAPVGVHPDAANELMLIGYRSRDPFGNHAEIPEILRFDV
jgi:hypothetical protein